MQHSVYRFYFTASRTFFAGLGVRYVIRPIMSTQRKCNRVCAAWWVFPITPLVRWGMPMAAFQHIPISQHCNSTLECVYIYFTARECVSNGTTGVREQWWQNSFHTDRQLPMICDKIVSAQMVSCPWPNWLIRFHQHRHPHPKEWEGLGELHIERGFSLISVRER